jgi:TonB-linked SusC/RagA family outer membrane protein
MKKISLLLTMVLFTLSMSLAQRTITGTVTSEKGEPLIGASVVAKGTANGTATDVDGNYSLKVEKDITTLVVSYVGYTSKEIELGTSNVANASLEEGTALNETIITAYGVKRNKKDLGYGAQEISSAELTTAHTTNVTNALNGKIAGVRIQGSGGAFSSSSIIIRGFTSFQGSNQPLYVIDGVAIDAGGGATPLQNGPSTSGRAIDIAQEDIETMSVLPGGAATVLYGARGANGVILITTKKGKQDSKTHITYSANFTVNDINRLPEYQNDYSQGSAGAYSKTTSTSWGARIAGQKVSNYLFNLLPGQPDSLNLTAYPNNVKDLFRTGSGMQHNLTLSGGTDKSSYRLSYGYLQENGVLTNNTLDRHNLTANVNNQLSSKLFSSISITYVNTQSIRTQQGNQLANPLFRSFFTPRSFDLTNTPFEDALGNEFYYGTEDNPNWSIKHIRYNDANDRVYGNAGLRYAVNDWLNAEYKVGMDAYALTRHGYDDLGNRGGGNIPSSASIGIGGIRERRDVSRNFSGTFTLSAQKKINNDLNVSLLLGHELVSEFSSADDIQGIGLGIRGFEDLKLNTSKYIPTYTTLQARNYGLFAIASGNYKGFLNLEASLRNDVSSTYSPANRSYLYWSTAASLSLLDAFKVKSSSINLAKIRGSYAIVGRRSPYLYATDNYYSQAAPQDGFGPIINFPFNGAAGYALQTTAGNPDLRPEFNTTTELGVDLGFFNNRITLTATKYHIKTTDAILNAPVSPASGVNSFIVNAGELNTDGWAVGLGLTPIKTKQGFYTMNFNFTQFKSIVTSLAENVQNVFLGGFTTPNIRLVAGDEYGQIYGTGYQRDAAGNLILTATGLPQATTDVKKIGNPNPKYTIGMNNIINYKALTLTFLIDYRNGGEIYSRNLGDVQRNGVAIETAEFSRFNSDGTVSTPYQYQGVNAAGVPVNVPLTAQQYWGNTGKYAAAEGFISDITWVRLREASIGFSLPKSILEKTPFGAIEVGVFGRNLFLYTPNYKHFDPEQNALGTSNAQGLEYNSQPQSRTLGLNLKASF